MGCEKDAIPDGFALSDYDFNLPENLIAQSPALNRGTSRLLVVRRNSASGFEEKIFTDITGLLPENCLLVANNSRVVPARLAGRRASGGKVEFLLLSPVPLLEPVSCSVPGGVGDAENMGESDPADTGDSGWFCAEAEGLLRSSKQIRQGEVVYFPAGLRLVLLERHDYGRVRVRLFWQGDLQKLLFAAGTLPLPPYIKRSASEDGAVLPSSGAWGNDNERYQTVYSREDKAGSVAAPTAGLHFTPELREAIVASGREWVEATLYVGYGTFSPVRETDIRNHTMHAEYVELSAAAAAAINKAKREGRPVIAIGTTSVRILEGVYRALYGGTDTGGALAAGQDLREYSGWVNLFLYPGQQFYLVDGLVTNFHLPGSSLLMLVSAFAGRERIMRAYAYAVEQGFKFFSYGDSMFIY